MACVAPRVAQASCCGLSEPPGVNILNVVFWLSQEVILRRLAPLRAAKIH
jgi:hypothetical protein